MIPLDFHSFILKVDPVTPLNGEYYFHFLIPSRDDWYPDVMILPDLLDIYTDGSKLDNRVGNGDYSGKLDLNISLLLSNYYCVFQVEVIVI